MGKNNVFTATVDNKEVQIKVIAINQKIREESQIIYADSFADAIDKKYPLTLEMDKILSERNLLNQEQQDKQIAELRKSLKDMEVRLRKGYILEENRKMSKEEGRLLALDMIKARNEISELEQKLTQLYNTCVEKIAENERLQYFMYATSIDMSTGKPYFKSFEAYKSADPAHPVIKKAYSIFLSQLFGHDVDIDQKPYEIQWLIRMKFMNSNEQFINSAGQTIDSEGRLINEDGKFVNDKGELVDIYGNRVDDKGNLIIEDGWTEEELPLFATSLETVKTS